MGKAAELQGQEIDSLSEAIRDLLRHISVYVYNEAWVTTSPRVLLPFDSQLMCLPILRGPRGVIIELASPHEPMTENHRK
jgi:hypothetical protein